jgi:methionyl-tRNA synthetase
MPESSRSIWQRLGLKGAPDSIDPSMLRWGELPEENVISGVERLSAKSKVMGVQQLFPRLDKTKIMSEINAGEKPSGVHATEADAVAASAPATQPAPPMKHATEADTVGVTSFIDIDDFAKVDLRVGQVLSAERVPKADKLLLLKVDLAEDQPRQILAGIAQYYEPEKLVGRKVVIVANLKPRKLRGFESQGMVVAASYGEEGRPVIATFTEDVPNGARLK